MLDWREEPLILKRLDWRKPFTNAGMKEPFYLGNAGLEELFYLENAGLEEHFLPMLD
jgi:hypothetical protein